MQRYFSLSNEEIIIQQDDIHHIKHVMRQRKGECFEVVFNQKIYKMQITSLDPFSYEVIDIDSLNNELSHKITIFYALSKGNKNEFVIQKATELGASRIVLLSSKRSICKMSQDDFLRKKARFEKIIKEAAEQSKRNIIPEILGVYPIEKIPESLLCDVNLLAFEEESGPTDKTFEIISQIKENQSVSILIGSEGGFEMKEVETLNSVGFLNISLGRRKLRTETAALAALSVISFMLERK